MMLTQSAKQVHQKEFRKLSIDFTDPNNDFHGQFNSAVVAVVPEKVDVSTVSCADPLSGIMEDLKRSKFARNINDDVLLELISMAEVKTFKAGTRFQSEEATTDEIYLLRAGTIVMTMDNAQHGVFRRGDCVGEISLAKARVLKEIQRWNHHEDRIIESLLQNTINYDCESDVVLLIWRVESLLQFVSKKPQFEYNLHSILEQWTHKMSPPHSIPKTTIHQMIARDFPLLCTGLLNNVASDKIPKILDMLTSSPATFTSGSQVVWRGDVGDTLFIVLSGLLSCQVNGKEVLTFGPGSSFGEVALCARMLSSSQSDDGGRCASDDQHQALASCSARTADVLCIHDSTLIELSAATMQAICAHEPQLYRNLLEAARGRLGQAAAHGSTEAAEALKLIKAEEQNALRARGRVLSVRETFDPSGYKTGRHRKLFNSSFRGSFSASFSLTDSDLFTPAQADLPAAGASAKSSRTFSEDSDEDNNPPGLRLSAARDNRPPAGGGGGSLLPARKIPPKFSQMAARARGDESD